MERYLWCLGNEKIIRYHEKWVCRAMMLEAPLEKR